MHTLTKYHVLQQSKDHVSEPLAQKKNPYSEMINYDE